MARLLDKKVKGNWPYKYIPAAQTNVAARFAAERRRLAALEDEGKVTPIKRAKK